MLHRSQNDLPQVQQSKLQNLQLEVETLWKRVRDKSILNSANKTEVESKKPVMNQNQQSRNV